jgi:hypothetical protein
MQDERATRLCGSAAAEVAADLVGGEIIPDPTGFGSTLHYLHFLILFAGVELAEQHGGVRGSEARDPPPAGGGGPAQLPGGGAHKPQEDRREAARGGAGIPTGACGV